MIKLEVIEPFTLGRFNELKNIQRKAGETGNLLNKGDMFECEQELADYLLGNNAYKRAYVRVIEVIPEEKLEQIEMPKKSKPKKTSKK